MRTLFLHAAIIACLLILGAAAVPAASSPGASAPAASTPAEKGRYEELEWLAPGDDHLGVLGQGRLRGMALSRKGGHMLTVDDASCLVLRKIPSGEVVWSRRDLPEACPNPVRSLALSDDGRLAAVGFKNLEQVHIWDLREGLLYRSLGSLAVKELLFSPEGKRLVVRDIADLLTLFDLEKGTVVYRSRVPAGACAFAGESLLLFTSKARLHRVEIGSGRETGASFFPGCTALAPAGAGTRMKAFFRSEEGRWLWRDFSWRKSYWNLGREWYVDVPEKLRAHRVSVSRDCSMLGFYAGDSVVVLEASSGRTLLELPVYANGLEMAPGVIALALPRDVHQDVEIWSVRRKRKVGAFTASLGFSGRWPALTLSYDGRRLVRGWPGRGELELWDTSKKRHRLYPEALNGTLVLPLRSNAALEPGGSRIAVNAEDEVRLLDMESGGSVILARFGREQGALKGVKALFSPDGAILAAARVDGVHLWDMRNAGAKPLHIPPAGPVDLAFSGDGRTLGAADFHGSLVVTDLAAGTRTGYEEKGRFLRMKLFLSRDGEYVGAMAFTPDDLSLCGLELWKCESPMRLMWRLPLPPPHLFYASASFSPDSRSLMVTLNYPWPEHTIHVLDAATGALQRTVPIPPMMGPNPPDASILWSAPLFAPDGSSALFSYPVTGALYRLELPLKGPALP